MMTLPPRAATNLAIAAPIPVAPPVMIMFIGKT
jgi:hypothetical protein